MKRPRRSSQSKTPQQVEAPGCFRPNGSWDFQGTPGPNTPIHAEIVSLIFTRRRRPDLLPKDFAEVIRASRLEEAFPNVGQWDTCDNWLAAHGTTSAEQAMKRMGLAGLLPNPVGVVPAVTDQVREVIEAVTRTKLPSGPQP